MTSPDLTKEQQQALDQNDGIVEGPSFVIIRTDVFRNMLGFGSDEDLQRQLQIGFDQADRGQLVDWNPDRIKSEARLRIQRRNQAS